MLCQGLMYFTSQNTPEGWTESWYANVDVPTTKTALEAIIPFRTPFLAFSAAIVAYRASTVGQPTRTSRLFIPAAPFVGGAGDTNEVGDAILYKLRSADSHSSRQVPFRGIPDAYISGDKLTPAGVAHLGDIDSYMNQVLANQFGLRVPDNGQARLATVSIQNLTVRTDLHVNTVLPHGYQSNDLIRVRHCKDMPLVNGLWRISVIDANNFSLNGSKHYACFDVGNATVQKVIQNFAPASGFGFGSVSFRKTGRPFGLRHGRSPVRVPHH